MTENRKSVRHDVDLAVTVTVDGEALQTVMQNLSVGGALITFGERLDLETRVQIAFRIPTHEDEINVQSTVRWSAAGAIGVQFDGLRAKEVWSLNKFFESLPG